MKPVLVDSNVILDIAWNDPRWAAWSEEMIESLAGEARLLINPVIFAEISVGYDRNFVAIGGKAARALLRYPTFSSAHMPPCAAIGC
jgi:predicted nucleic acid-binding protein